MKFKKLLHIVVESMKYGNPTGIVPLYTNLATLLDNAPSPSEVDTQDVIELREQHYMIDRFKALVRSNNKYTLEHPDDSSITFTIYNDGKSAYRFVYQTVGFDRIAKDGGNINQMVQTITYINNKDRPYTQRCVWERQTGKGKWTVVDNGVNSLAYITDADLRVIEEMLTWHMVAAI